LKYRSMSIRILSVLVVFIFSLLLLCSCREPIELGFHDKGSSIELEKGEEIIISLDSNPTTGYSWVPGEEIDSTIVELTDSEFLQTEKEEGMVGVGGFEVFTFEAKNSGQTEIILYYQRPWEEAELKDEFIFNIEVTVK
jgi:inhibitor of cysteine peptidase